MAVPTADGKNERPVPDRGPMRAAQVEDERGGQNKRRQSACSTTMGAAQERADVWRKIGVQAQDVPR
jgi:hypothetical protein